MEAELDAADLNDSEQVSCQQMLDLEAEHGDYLLGMIAAVYCEYGQLIVDTYRGRNGEKGVAVTKADMNNIVKSLKQGMQYLSKDRERIIRDAVMFKFNVDEHERSLVRRGFFPAWRDDHELSDLKHFDFQRVLNRCY